MSQTSKTNLSLSLVAASIIGINGMIISSAAQAEAIVLDTIVVTGEKIDKNIKDTTTAVTVISEDELAKGDVENVLDLATQAPNVVPDAFGNISIRGLSGGGAATGGTGMTTGSRPRVSTVVDGTSQDWFGYNYTPSKLWDAEQVEILRGPQSTVQGSSAIGGAMVINTNDPTFDSEAAIKAGLENYENGNLKYNVAAMSSGALIEDELAYRIAIDKTQGEGWINYDTSDYVGDIPNLSDSDNLNVRSKLLWQPNDKLSAKLTATHTENEGEYLSLLSNTDDKEYIETATVDLGTSESRQQDSSADSLAANIDYQLNADVTNSLHISHNEADIYAKGYVNYGSANTNHVYTVDQTKTTIEDRLLFSSSEAKLNGFLGLFISDNDAYITSTQNSLSTNYTTLTTALYGEGTYSLSDKTKMTFGLRLENEDTDKAGEYNTSGEVFDDINNTYSLPKLAITHTVSESTTLGASIRQGYNPGGTGIGLFTSSVYSFDSEEVTTIEFSSKSDFGAGTTLNASLFYNDYTDYQGINSYYDVVNVDAATTFGIEVEATTWLGENFELWGGLGLLRSEIDKYADETSYEGNELSSAPESNLSLGFTQYIGTDLSVSADATYVTEYYSDLANSDNTTVGDYTVLNASTQYIMGDLTINTYIKNLTNEVITSSRADRLADVGQTRTYGINAIYRM